MTSPEGAAGWSTGSTAPGTAAGQLTAADPANGIYVYVLTKSSIRHPARRSSESLTSIHHNDDAPIPAGPLLGSEQPCGGHGHLGSLPLRYGLARHAPPPDRVKGRRQSRSGGVSKFRNSSYPGFTAQPSVREVTMLVDEAFDIFQKKVDADSWYVRKARHRRDLFGTAFKRLDDVIDVIPSGSLARGTQLNPINDVDL